MKKRRTALIYASPSPASFLINTILNLLLTSKRWGYELDMSTLILIYLQTGSRPIGGLAQTHVFSIIQIDLIFKGLGGRQIFYSGDMKS